MTLLRVLGWDDSTVQTNGGTAAAGNGAGRLGGQSTGRVGTTLVDMVTLTTAVTGLALGVAISTTATSTTIPILLVVDSGGTTHFQIRISAGELLLLGPAGTTVASTSGLGLLSNVWYYIEFKCTIADSGGTVTVRVNESTVISFTGDTRNAGSGNIAKVQHRSVSGVSTFYDDCYVCDLTDATATQGSPFNDFLGDCAVAQILPSGNGDSSGWTGSDGNSTDNYLLVDETDATATDYVGASTSGLTDLYAMSDVASTSAVYAYKELTFAAKSDAGTPPVLKPVAKGAAGTVREETAVSLTTTYQLFASDLRTTDPDGNALTASRLNSMQAGVRSA